MEKVGVGIMGLGFLGEELDRVLAGHPFAEVLYKKSSGREEGSLEEVGVVFMALPPEQSLHAVSMMLQKGKRVIDLSGAYRLKDTDEFERWYGFSHPYGHVLKYAHYSVPEITVRRGVDLRSVALVANSGCWAACVIRCLAPFLENNKLIRTVIVHGVSGVTGLGVERAKDFKDGAESYKPGRAHRHIPEIKKCLEASFDLLMYPVVASYARGLNIAVTVMFNGCEALTTQMLLDMYGEFYRKSPFVLIRDNIDTHSVERTNLCFISPVIEKEGLVTIRACLDNLGGGGSHSAVQNFNLMVGADDTAGLL